MTSSLTFESDHVAGPSGYTHCPFILKYTGSSIGVRSTVSCDVQGASSKFQDKMGQTRVFLVPVLQKSDEMKQFSADTYGKFLLAWRIYLIWRFALCIHRL